MIAAALMAVSGCGDATPSDARIAPREAQAQASQRAGAAPARQDFAAFWRAFRAAALARDAAAAAALTRFPLVVRGELDDDPQARVGRADFPRTFDRLLAHAEDPFATPARTLRDELASDPTMRPATADAARYGPMLFERTPQGWRLTMIYIGVEE